jgi:hypothetical protein
MKKFLSQFYMMLMMQMLLIANTGCYIRPLVEIIITVFYLLIIYLLELPNTPENPFASIYSESLIQTACQHLLLLVGFETLIYRKYYDTPPILVGHHSTSQISCRIVFSQ